MHETIVFKTLDIRQQKLVIPKQGETNEMSLGLSFQAQGWGSKWDLADSLR